MPSVAKSVILEITHLRNILADFHTKKSSPCQLCFDFVLDYIGDYVDMTQEHQIQQFGKEEQGLHTLTTI